jgi:hypothetical protein
MKKNIENIEPYFKDFVRETGGIVIDDCQSNLPQGLENPDFMYTLPNIIPLIEMKIMSTNFNNDEAFMKKGSDIYNNWVNEGKNVPIIYGTGDFNLGEIPEECAREFLRNRRKKLSGICGKANKQLASFKNYLEKTWPAAATKPFFGMLFLINDGNYAFTPEETLWQIAQFFKNSSTYSHIEFVNYITINMEVNMSDHAGPRLIWAGMVRDPNYTNKQENNRFNDYLLDNWTKKFQRDKGLYTPAIKGSTHDLVGSEYVEKK